jgi:hypothetical protein
MSGAFFIGSLNMTEGIHSHGTKLGIGDGASPEVFSNLPEGTAIPAFGGTVGLIDATSHDTVGFKDYLPQAVAEGEELEVTSNHIPDDADVAKFKAAYTAKTAKNFLITLSDGGKYLFPGIVLGWKIDPSELDGLVKSSFRIKMTGEPSYTAGA